MEPDAAVFADGDHRQVLPVVVAAGHNILERFQLMCAVAVGERG